VSEELKTQKQVEDLMQPGGGTAIIDFWSPSCGPCMAMAPEYDLVSEEMSEEPIRFLKLNTAQFPKLAAPFRIRAVPTILFVHDGEILDVRVGAMNGPALVKKAKWLLSKARGEGLISRLFGGGAKNAEA
jgi:thiol-disulfide isomerase/thioredoxin